MEKLNSPTDASAASWFPDLVMEEEYNLSPEECHLNLLDDVDEGVELISHDIESALKGKTLKKQSSLSSDCTSKTLRSNSYISFERPAKLLKKSSNNNPNSFSITENFSPKLSFSSSSVLSFQSQILSFDKSNSWPTTQFYGGLDCTLTPKQIEDEVVSVSHLSQLGNTSFSVQTPNGSSKTQNLETKKTKNCKKALAPAPDHVMAERKRREKLNQSFIALTALVPGIKKLDKASVLENTVKYMKELKDRLAVLEEESKKTKAESVVVVNKAELYGAYDSSSCDEISTDASGGATSESFLQVEAKASGQEVLLRIQCQKLKGILVKILDEIQRLHLFVLSSSVLPFGDSILEITIIAQMGEEYNLTLKELVKNIRVATLKFMS